MALWSLAGLIVLVLLVFIAVQTPPARNYVLSRVLQAVPGLRAQSLRYGLTDGTATLTGVEWGTFLTADRVDVDISLRSAWNRSIVVESLVIDNLAVNLVIDENGNTNIPDLGPDDGTPPANELPDFLIQRATANGSFSLTSPDATAQLPAWTLGITGTSGPRHNVTFGLGQAGTAQYVLSGETRNPAIETLQLNAAFTRENVTIEQLQVAITGAQIAASGTMQGFADREVEARVQVLADLEPALGPLAREYNLTGQVTANAAAEWSPADGGRLRLESARVETPEGVITADAAYELGDEAARNQADVRIERLDVARVARKFDTDIRAALGLTGTARVEWTGSQFQAAGVNANVRVAGSGLTANARVTTNLERRNLDGNVHAEVPDAARTLAAFQVQTNTPVEGELVLDADLGGTWDRPTAMAELAGSNIRAGDVRNLTLTARANYTPELLEVPEALITWQNTRITAQATLGLQGESRPLTFTASSTEVAIPDLLSLAGRTEPVTGFVAFNAQGTGTLEAPRVTASISGRDLVAYDEPLGQLTAQVNYFDPVVDVTELRLTRPSELGTLAGTARYDLDTRAYAVNLKGDAIVVNRPEGSATVNASITGMGTVDDPAADIEITASNVVAQGRMLGEVTLTGTVANRTANINLAAPAFNIRAEARASTDAPYNTTATVFLDNTDLATLPIGEGPVAEGAEPPVRGTITARIDASGPAERWREGEVRASISALRIETDAGEFTNTEPVLLAYRNEVAEVESARFAGPGSTFSIAGRLPGTLNVDGDVDIAALPLGEGVEAAGRVNLAAQLTGTFERIVPTAKIRVTEASYETAQNIEVEASLTNGLLTVDRLGARIGTGILSGQGSVPLSLFPLPEIIDVPAMTGPAEFEASLLGLNFRSIADLPQGTDGTISFTLRGQTSRPELEALTAEATINQLIVAAQGVRVQTTRELPRITLNNGVATIEQFHLSGPATSLDISGGASLIDRTLRDVAIDGTVNAGLLNSFTDTVRATGDLMVHVAAEGTFTEPSATGAVTMAGGTLSLEDPRIDATNLNLRLALNGREIAIEELNGDLNGGTLTASGTIGLANPIAPNVQLKLNDVFMDVPEGLQTRVSADLNLAPRGGDLLLAGTATIHEGGYSEPLDLQRAAEEYLGSSGGGVELVEDRDPLLSRLQFDVAINSEDPIVLDNNLGKLAIATDLHLGGNYYRPGLTGAITIAEGGTLRLQERDYVIERGTVNFVNETRIQPVLDIVADTQVRNTEITVNIATDAAGEHGVEFTSDNADYTRADIISLLVTGKTAEEIEGGQALQAGELAAASLLAGSITGRLSQRAQSSLGTTAVRIEPNLISQESDPTARLTIGQDLTQFLQFIYSMNLRNSSDQIWSINFNVRPNVNTRATKQEDNSYRFDFQHDLRFGLERAGDQMTAVRAPRNIASVAFEGDLAVAETELRERFEVEPGDSYNFFDIRDGLDRLERFYRDRGHLESRVRLHRTEEGTNVALNIEVTAGPVVEFVFEGMDAPGGLREEVRDAWMRGVFDTQRTEGAVAQIERRLGRDGFLQPTVEAEIRMPAADRRNVLFTIDRGTRYKGAEMAFEGAQGIPPDELREQLDKAELLEEPREARDFLVTYYRQHGFLDVQVETPAYEYNEEEGSARLVTQIEEGPHYRWGTMSVAGAAALSETEVRTFADLPQGDFYTPQVAQDSRDRVEEEYWRRGYRDVTVEYALTRDAENATVNVSAVIAEGPKSIVRAIDVAGTQVTSPGFVRAQIPFKPGDVYDFTKSVDARRNLYATGAYSAVELRTESMTLDPLAAYKDVRLLATVQEPNPYRLRYGGFFDTDRGPGVIVDLRNTNSLGGGRVIGFRGRYDYDGHEARAFFSQPLIRSLPLRTDAAVFTRREFQRTDLEDGTEDVVITDRIGFSAQEGVQLREKFFLTFGYRYEIAHTYEQEPDPFLPFDETIHTAPLTSTLTREDRDDILDATRGSFTSHSFELSLASLGSDLRFWRYFGQYFRYFPLSDPAPVPFAGGLEKSRLVFATGARVGLARGLDGQSVVRSQRFFTGGGTTLRGFEQDTVGPLDIIGRPNGGEAMFLLNSEIRFPAISIFDGVGFLDLGNVYRRIEDFSLTDIRKTAGLGIRVRTPYFLIRVDYGLKLDRRADESRGELFFSIGQAF